MEQPRATRSPAGGPERSARRRPLDLTGTDGREQRGARGTQDREERAPERLIRCGGGVSGGRLPANILLKGKLQRPGSWRVRLHDQPAVGCSSYPLESHAPGKKVLMRSRRAGIGLPDVLVVVPSPIWAGPRRYGGRVAAREDTGSSSRCVFELWFSSRVGDLSPLHSWLRPRPSCIRPSAGGFCSRRTTAELLGSR
jgi:hypothetical protein